MRSILDQNRDFPEKRHHTKVLIMLRPLFILSLLTLFSLGGCARDVQSNCCGDTKRATTHPAGAFYSKVVPRANMEDIRKAADQGDPLAQNKLGTIYEHDGVEQSFVEAIKWYRKAAEQGNADAQYNLGTLLEFGRPGIKRDSAEGFTWLRKAAEQGASH